MADREDLDYQRAHVRLRAKVSKAAVKADRLRYLQSTLGENRGTVDPDDLIWRARRAAWEEQQEARRRALAALLASDDFLRAGEKR